MSLLARDNEDISLAVNGITISTDSTVVTGTYGSLTINKNGYFEYTLDNTNATVNALDGDDDDTDGAVGSLTETISVTYTLNGQVETRNFNITINGKTDRLYRTPLTSEVVERIAPLKSYHKYVFDNNRSRLRHISPNVITMQFKKIPNYEVTAHGWRASLKTWATENSYRQEVTEMQLSHEKDKLEAAYNRTDYFAERAEMINNWQRYLMGE